MLKKRFFYSTGNNSKQQHRFYFYIINNYIRFVNFFLFSSPISVTFGDFSIAEKEILTNKLKEKTSLRLRKSEDEISCQQLLKSSFFLLSFLSNFMIEVEVIETSGINVKWLPMIN